MNQELKILIFESMLQAKNIAIYSVDTQGAVTLWNKGAEVLYGYTSDEIMGKSILQLMPNDVIDEERNIIDLIKQDKNLSEYETIHIKKNGNKVDVILEASPIKNNLNTIIGILIVSRDITKKKENTMILAVQYRIATILSESIDLSIAFRSLLETICEIFNWELGELWAIVPEKKEFRNATMWHSSSISPRFEEMSKDLFFKMDEDLLGEVLNNRTPTYFNDLTKYKINEHRQEFFPNKLVSCFGVPVVFKNKIFAVILFFSHEKKEFNYSLKTMFMKIGEQIGLFVKSKRLESELLYLAEHDKLTGLINPKLFERYINEEIHKSSKNNEHFAVFVIDLDFFKKINDNLGNRYADQVLREISKRLSQSVRETDIVARIGGDEFSIFLSHVDKLDVIPEIANKILLAISKPIIINKIENYITVSVGVSICPDDAKTASRLIGKASQAMNYAKSLGGNNYQFSRQRKNFFTKKKLILEAELHHALEKKEMELYYQPIAEVKSGLIVGAEALIRWHHPCGILLHPDRFIPLAAQSYMISKLGDWVIQAACSQLHNLEDEDLKFIAVNVSSQQFNNTLIKTIKQNVEDNKIRIDQITIEITEDTLMVISDENIDLISKLKELGVQIAIDDFGTGYSSLAYIKSFQVDKLKIDKSFISTVPYNQNSVAIVTAIIAMSKALNIYVIAEGVENEVQLKFLQENGCDLFQGFYLSKPLPANRFCQFLRKNKSHFG